MRCNLVIPQCMCQVSLRLKEVQMGTYDFKYNKVPFFCSKTREYQYFDVCCPETSSCASKPLLMRCNLVIPQCMCQVSLRLKEVQMGTYDFKYNKVPFASIVAADIEVLIFPVFRAKRGNLLYLKSRVPI